MNLSEKQLKNYDILTITLKLTSLSKLSLSSSGSSSDGSTTTCSTSMNDKVLKINDYDFAVSGYCPSFVHNLNVASVAYKCGLRTGDFIIKINGVNCCRATLKSIQKLIQQKTQDNALTLVVYRMKTVVKGKTTSTKQQTSLPATLTTTTTDKNQSCKKRKFKLSSLFKAAVPRSCVSQMNTTMNTTCYFNTDMITNEKATTVTESGYETLDHQQQHHNGDDESTKHDETEISIGTITNTTNSYSCYDLTMSEIYNQRSSSKRSKLDSCESIVNKKRTNLIGQLIECEIDFTDYLSNGVSTFSRPLRGFFIRQTDYFLLFQNIEKLLVINENFLQSMQKWSPFDIYIHIGQFYCNKIKLLQDALQMYYQGYMQSKYLLNDLIVNSKKFRSFLKETETSSLNLNSFLDMPIVHFKKLIKLLKQIMNLTTINSNEYVNLENTINELKQLLSNVELLSDNNELRNVELYGNSTILTETTTSSDESSLSSYEEATTFFNSSFDLIYQQQQQQHRRLEFI